MRILTIITLGVAMLGLSACAHREQQQQGGYSSGGGTTTTTMHHHHRSYSK